MAQAVMVNFRLDETDKKGMEQVCNEIGISMSAAFTIFAKKVSREKRIPFELNVDPFYSKDNMNKLKRILADMESGENMSEHDLIEAD